MPAKRVSPVNDVNISPMSDRGAPSGGGGFSYLKKEPAAILSEAPDLPSTVTRRAPPRAKPSNPWSDAAPAAIAGRAEVTGIRRPVVSRGKGRVDPFAQAMMDDEVPQFALPLPKRTQQPSAPAPALPSLPLDPPAPARATTPTRRSTSGSRRSVSNKVQSPTSSKQQATIPACHVPLSSLLASLDNGKRDSVERKVTTPKASPKVQTTGFDYLSNDDEAAVRSRPSTFLHVKRGVSLCLQLTAVVAVIAVAAIAAVTYAAPLFIRFDAPEELYIRAFVPTISELQGIYQEPAYGLNASETRCLYLRVLHDRTEALDRAIELNAKGASSADVEASALHEQRVARAHHMLRHRVRLYARTRDSGFLNQVLFYPFRDAWVYGVVRHGWLDTFHATFIKPNLADWYRRTKEVAVCTRQAEQLPCPSVEYVEERAERHMKRDGRVVYPRGSLEHAKQLSAQIVDRSKTSNPWYNDQFCAALASSKKRSSSS